MITDSEKRKLILNNYSVQHVEKIIGYRDEAMDEDTLEELHHLENVNTKDFVAKILSIAINHSEFQYLYNKRIHKQVK